MITITVPKNQGVRIEFEGQLGSVEISNGKTYITVKTDLAADSKMRTGTIYQRRTNPLNGGASTENELPLEGDARARAEELSVQGDTTIQTHAV